MTTSLTLRKTGSFHYCCEKSGLEAGGVFCNLEHVASPTSRLHDRFLEKMGITPEEEDASNILLDVETQLHWLRELGFVDVDCLWKWRELAFDRKKAGGLKWTFSFACR